MATAQMLVVYKILVKCMSIEWDAAINCMMQDAIVVAVSKVIYYRVDNCDMHQISKVSEFALEDCILSKQNRVMKSPVGGQNHTGKANHVGKILNMYSVTEGT